MAIPIQNHSQLIASKVVGAFSEDIPVRAGFSDAFPRETTPTLHVDVEVERDNDLISVDVMRFTEGNKNKRTKVSQSKYEPPFHNEQYDFARDEIYMNTVALAGVTSNVNVNAAIAQNALKAVRNNRKKVERAIMKQQADVLQTGIVTVINGDNIDYRRKATSIVDLGASKYWSVAASDPIADFINGMKFLRNVGNSGGTIVNAFMRESALNALLNNANAALAKALDSRRMDRANITMPQFNEISGMGFHGQIAAGDFSINLWTYNEKYTNASGVTKYYLEEYNVIMLPSDFRGKTIFGGLPYMRQTSVGGQSIKVPGVMEADYLIRGWDDEKTISSTLELTSAPLVVPFTIDKIYTMKVLASS